MKQNLNSGFIEIKNINASPLKAIQFVMGLINIQNFSDVLYITEHYQNDEIYTTFKNSLVVINNCNIDEIGKQKHRFLASKLNTLDDEFGLKTDSF